MERLEEELTCAICCDTFRDPRLLPCSHTFCAPCLRRLLRPPLGSCPSCRAPVAVPAPGPEALPFNLALKAVIERMQQEERAREQQQQEEEEEAAEWGPCSEHPRQPRNIFCLQERQLVCGRCVTIGRHRGHPIDDLRSAYGRARAASARLREQLWDQSRCFQVLSCSQRLRQHKARCQGALQSHREAVLQRFKELGDALEQKKAALLSALDEVERCLSEKCDPLIEEVEKLKLEEKELKELHAALQEEESPLLFLEKLQRLQQRLQALREKRLPEPEPLEVQPSMEKVLQDISTAELGQLHKVPAPKLQLAHQRPAGHTAAAALWAALTEPSIVLLVLTSVVVLWHEEISSAALPAPLGQLWRFLLQIYQDCCTSLQDKVYELCYTSALPLQLCRRIFPY
ncbi:TRI59 protein, partial [Oenanthe oenanthe]|nr:TRI59 protein [Oenanthe oenanthe]